MKQLTDQQYNEVQMPNLLIGTAKKNPLTPAEKKTLIQVFKNVTKIRKHFIETFNIDLSLAETVKEVAEMTNNQSYIIKGIKQKEFINEAVENKTKMAKYAWDTAENLIERSLKISPQEAETLYGDKKRRIVNIIMEINYDNDKKEFEIEVSPRMVQIILLLQNKLWFTTGDFQLLMDLSNERNYAWEIYWIIREKQYLQVDGAKTLELIEFKRTLGIEDKYTNRNDNLKTYVIEPARERLKGTWAEFTYKIWYSRSKKKHFITFEFKNDMQNQISNEMAEIGLKHEKWVSMCKEHGISAKVINDFRIRINNREVAPNAKKMFFSSYYIEATIKRSRVEARTRAESKYKKNIDKLSSHIITAINDGYYTEEIEKAYFDRPDTDQQKLYNEIFVAWSTIAEDSKKAIFDLYGSFEEFANAKGYKIEVRDGIKGHIQTL